MILQKDGLLPIVTFDSKDDWDSVLDLASPHLEQDGLGRLKSALEMAVKAVAIERHYIDKDYRDTFANFHARRFSTPDSRCVRLHFFTEAVDHRMIQHAEQVQEHYAGYSIIRPTRPNCVGRTLLEPAACGLKNACVTLCTEHVSIQGTKLRVKGFPFISQDADVTVCAQSALWMLSRYFSNRYQVYPETYPYRLTTLTRDYSIGRLMPTAGLYIWQMAEALRQMGFAPLIYDRSQYGEDFEHWLYSYVESGIPILAAFDSHVVVLFGHRSDYSNPAEANPVAGKPFIVSSQFNKAFVGNDDNGYPYQILNGAPGGMSKQLADLRQFVAPLPERVFLPAESFHNVVTAILSRPDIGFKARSPIIAAAPPLLRMFLTSGKSFKRHLAERQMGSPTAEEVYRNLPLPHFIWVCEISHPDLYPRQVWGEIIWDATRNAYEPDGWVALHYPEFLIVDWGSALNRRQDLILFSLPEPTAYPIYSNNLESL
jgi:hypothetical protein